MEDAIATGSYFPNPLPPVQMGIDINQALAASDRVVTGQVEVSDVIVEVSDVIVDWVSDVIVAELLTS